VVRKEFGGGLKAMSSQYDYEEEQRLKEFAKETVRIADEYANARAEYAEAKLKMDSKLADAYETGKIKDTLAVEKAYVQLTLNDPETEEDYKKFVKEEQAYKGLEQVLKARETYVSLHQSLIKIKQQTGIA
jgi:hypothetical protein